MQVHRIGGWLRTAAAAGLLLSGQVWAQSLPDTVVPVPATAGKGHAWNNGAFARVPQDIGSLGYAEQEYLFRGTANVYGLNGSSGVKPIASGPYVDRMLIRYPVDISRFSGTVVFEVINGNLGFDGLVAWTDMWRQITRSGDIWVGVSTNKGLAALRQADPNRYGLLTFANPNKNASTLGCQQPAEEDGLIYDVITQAANLLRQSGNPLNPLRGEVVKAIIATGYSQPALLLNTYTNLIVPSLPYRPFDGYMVSGASGGGNVNSCTSAPPGEYAKSHGEPVIQTQTMSETATLPLGLVPSQQSDGNSASNKYRYYDLAGTAHIDHPLIDAVPNPSELAAAGFDMDAFLRNCGAASNLGRFPSYVIYDNLLAKLEAWVRNGTPPPPSQRFLLSGLLGLGTPVGGLRSPGVDVPIANYGVNGVALPVVGALLPQCSGGNLSAPNALFAVQTDFSAGQLQSRYATHQTYVNQVTASALTQFQNGFLTDYDAVDLIQQAAAANVPPAQ